jgi:DNA-binding HxlR family transcriptional regulator
MTVAPAPKRHPYHQWSPDARALDLVGDKWTLLIIRDLACGPKRFVELLRSLPGISTEQLRSRLNRMVADGILTRKRFREVPPRVDYTLTPRAEALMPVLGELARWGYKWAWSQPREGERLDVGAIFRLAPGLIEPGECRGRVECTVTDGPAGTAALVYTLTLADRGAAVRDEPCPDAEARISGSEAAWIDAFSPGPSRCSSALLASGDELLGNWLVEQLGGSLDDVARPEPTSVLA